MILFVLGLALGYIVGDKFRKQTSKPVESASEEEIRRVEREAKHIKGLMSYDAKQAYGGKR